jgi:signal transduction histidine kinase
MTADPDPRRQFDRVRRLTRTVRFRVTALATLAVLIMLVVAAVGLVAAQARMLTSNLDEAVREGARAIEAAVVTGAVPTALGGFGDDDTMAQVVTADGQVVAATPNVDGAPPIGAAPPSSGDAVRTVDRLDDEGDRFRLLSRRVDTPGGTVDIHVAATLDDIDESTTVLVTSLTIAIPAVVALVAALVWWVVGRTLRPVEDIRAQVADIGGSDLDRRVPVGDEDDEIAHLARTMNAMLDRIEQVADRQQRFVADASHELRAPLTRIRAALEVDLVHPGNADLLATHRSALDETVGLQHLVADLLHLARSDAGVTGLRQDPVDLDDIVLQHARRLRSETALTVDMTEVSAVQVAGDAGQLGRAIGNLADNAARHAASQVCFSLRADEANALLTVTDDGPGIPPDQRARVFERFTRLDDSRHSGTGGAGLGLAIARDIVRRHGGDLTIETGGRSGTRFVMTVPAGAPV